MRYLKEFNEYQPDIDSVERWESLLDKKYQIKEYKGDKLIMIDDKSYYLTGSFFNKGRLTQKIFWDIKSDADENGSVIHEPSLRKAIKNWIDKNNI